MKNPKSNIGTSENTNVTKPVEDTNSVTFVFTLTYSDGKEVYSNGEYHILPKEKALMFQSLGFGEISVSN